VRNLRPATARGPVRSPLLKSFEHHTIQGLCLRRPGIHTHCCAHLFQRASRAVKRRLLYLFERPDAARLKHTGYSMNASMVGPIPQSISEPPARTGLHHPLPGFLDTPGRVSARARALHAIQTRLSCALQELRRSSSGLRPPRGQSLLVPHHGLGRGGCHFSSVIPCFKPLLSSSPPCSTPSTSRSLRCHFSSVIPCFKPLLSSSPPCSTPSTSRSLRALCRGRLQTTGPFCVCSGPTGLQNTLAREATSGPRGNLKNTHWCTDDCKQGLRRWLGRFTNRCGNKFKQRQPQAQQWHAGAQPQWRRVSFVCA
jgi:hypothetical protein